MLRLINRARAWRGIPKVKLWGKLTKKARKHSIHMAEEGAIFHSACLPCQSPNDNWRALGENVARAPWIRGVHKKLMRSAAHAANILCSCFKRVGLGIVRSSGQTYVTQLFWG